MVELSEDLRVGWWVERMVGSLAGNSGKMMVDWTVVMKVKKRVERKECKKVESLAAPSDSSKVASLDGHSVER